MTQIDDLLMACSQWAHSLEQLDGVELAVEIGQLRRSELAKLVDAIANATGALQEVMPLVDDQVREFDAQPAEMAEAIAALDHSTAALFEVKNELDPTHVTRPPY